MSDNIYHDDPSSHHAIILVNLGSPKTASYFAIAKFLRQFLSDSRVIKLPKLLWHPILYGFILPFRSKRLVHSYKEICQDGQMPLIKYTRNLADKMDSKTPENVHVRYALRYGDSSIAKAIASLKKYPIKKLTILPLFPQYSASTSASVFDDLSTWAQRQNFLWNTKFIHTYHQHPAYIEAISASIKRHWKSHGQQHLIMSFHGLPKSMLTKGDPYYCYCMQTVRLIAEHMGLKETQYTACFQSRFGRAEWLKPYADDVIPKLAKDHQKVDVICPGFAADCLETLEEVAIGYDQLFKDSGGYSLKLIPCLNDHDDHVRALIAISAKDVF